MQFEVQGQKWMGAEDENAFENGLNATQLQNVGSSLFFIPL